MEMFIISSNKEIAREKQKWRVLVDYRIFIEMTVFHKHFLSKLSQLFDQSTIKMKMVFHKT